MDAYFISWGNAAPSASAKNYVPVGGRQQGGPTGAANEARAQQPLPHALTIGKNARVDLAVAPGVGATWTFTLRVNGSSTGIVVTISGNSTSGSYSGAGVACSQGDLVAWEINPSAGTPTVAGFAMSAAVRQTAAGVFAVLFGDGVSSLSATAFLGLQGGATGTAEGAMQVAIPFGCSISNLFTNNDVAPGAGNGWTTTLRKGTSGSMSNSALTCSIAATGAGSTGKNSDLTHSVSCVAGDVVSIQAVATGTPTATRFSGSLTITPTNDGDAAWFGATGATAAAAATNYSSVTGSSAGWQTSEALGNPQVVVPGPVSIKALYVVSNGSPGSSPRSFAVTVRDSGVDTAATATLQASSSDSGTKVAATGLSVAIPAGDLVDFKSVPSSPTAPTARDLSVSVHYVALVDVVDSGTNAIIGAPANVKQAPSDFSAAKFH